MKWLENLLRCRCYCCERNRNGSGYQPRLVRIRPKETKPKKKGIIACTPLKLPNSDY